MFVICLNKSKVKSMLKTSGVEIWAPIDSNFYGDEWNALLWCICALKNRFNVWVLSNNIRYCRTPHSHHSFIRTAFNGLLVSFFFFPRCFSHTEFSIFVYIDFPSDFSLKRHVSEHLYGERAVEFKNTVTTLIYTERSIYLKMWAVVAFFCLVLLSSRDDRLHVNDTNDAKWIR